MTTMCDLSCVINLSEQVIFFYFFLKKGNLFTNKSESIKKES